MEDRISNTSLTHRFPFPSLTFLCQQHLGTRAWPELLPSPLLGWGVCVCVCLCMRVWGEGAEMTLPGRNVLKTGKHLSCLHLTRSELLSHLLLSLYLISFL